MVNFGKIHVIIFLFPILFNHGWSTGLNPLTYRRPPQVGQDKADI